MRNLIAHAWTAGSGVPLQRRRGRRQPGAHTVLRVRLCYSFLFLVYPLHCSLLLPLVRHGSLTLALCPVSQEACRARDEEQRGTGRSYGEGWDRKHAE
eukprot:1575782-Rhodomonas_salina.3